MYEPFTPRLLKKDLPVFVFNYQEPELHGFGKILKTIRPESAADIVHVQVNHSDKIETTADRIYPLATNRICLRCGCVVLRGPHNDCFEQPWPYYCPDCDDIKDTKETIRVRADAFHEFLKDSTGRFLPDEEC